MTAWLLVFTVVLLGANAFFVAVEFALIASRRTALEPLAAAGDRRARRSLKAVGELNLQLAGSQLGITMASLGLGAVAEPAIAGLIESGILQFAEPPEGLLHAIGFLVALLIVVFAHLVFGEMVPKAIAITHPEQSLLRLSGLNRLYVAIFRPALRVLTAMANAGTRALGVEPRDELATTHSADELARLLHESREEGILGETVHQLLTGALRLERRDLGSILVPPASVVSLNRGDTVAAAELLVVEHGVSRLLVLEPDGQRVVGFVHAKDLLDLPPDAHDRPIPPTKVRRVLTLERSLALDEVLVEMRRARTHVAAVVADGRFVGLATLEDVLESVVGDILDESD